MQVMCMVRAHLVAISSVVKSPIDVDSDWLVFCIFAGEVVGFPCLYNNVYNVENHVSD